ncbi:uncharacterized protein LOC125668448 [Ostrea edulis]|uniref:uncharacterized protein LOC125668448 n=1 Tax=Ostrea edulis TaxID=37623 RepID=UPI00209467D4|nr:uncharacterized protein LOC125668448 [Ostrea edulis]XP_048758577.1 uncharacterized protein LOC125668448 [Ostrea edulis]XP_048758578.1 uncharacterized protein LOC125668448 [Ostrea edulis]XP_048758580.1 uncharacterized protein LOC125668448 [Ostrea edulis]XP_048758581.1 uncharacterized protein LOC125668448 [Ostrea edulis]
MTSTGPAVTPINTRSDFNSLKESMNALTAGEREVPDKPTEDAKEVCLGNYDAGEYRSKSALKMPKSERLKRIDIQEAANNIIEATNKKRKKDSDMLRDFKKTAEYQLCTTLLEMQHHIHHVYERQGKLMEEKMQELMARLERIGKLEQELAEFRKALQLLYHDIN